jgi:SAM-dependent methyltransferase
VQPTQGPTVLLDLLACPDCRAQLRDEGMGIVCSNCGRAFAVDDGIPVFVDGVAASHDELDHHDGMHSSDAAHKGEQSRFFDRVELAEFEIERPAGTPRLYEFLLREKFRRAVEPLGSLAEWSALVVCGGSGMDAEFLARAGATVTSSDISLGAAKRTLERAMRHGVRITPIVADVEHLPFADQSFDLVYVHDGLHHLQDPFVGLGEMARVARRAVCITEPSQAAATAIAVGLGLALEREEAGNLVARILPERATAVLASSGFAVTRSRRYLMYYRHVPGRVMSSLSRPGAFACVVWSWRVADRLLGRLGNKVVIVGWRRSRSTAEP